MNYPPPLLAQRHQPSGLNSRFSGGQLMFDDYVRHTCNMLHEFHARRGVACLNRIVDGNAPFELRPETSNATGQHHAYRRGVLLTHGLTDSPYFMKYLAAFFQENGFRVMAILLPGHGTRPGDLLKVSWREWSKAVAYGVDRLAAEADEIYLAGFSAGGALSVYQCLHDERVRGLFLFSPALAISPRAKWANWHKLYSWMYPAAQWVGIKPDCDIYKYESFPKNGAAQMYALTQSLGRLLPSGGPVIPVFAAASADDQTVESAATLNFMARLSHPASRLVLYTGAAKVDLKGFPPERLELVNSVLPEQKILGSAHTAILLPADDMHYGARGEYVNCVHYYPHDMEKYSACLAHPELAWQGELTEANLKAGVLRRLMYNPNFSGLLGSLRQFIARLT